MRIDFFKMKNVDELMFCQIDSLFIADANKFISGVLCSLSAMVQLELPHINVLTKCDLVDEKELEKYKNKYLMTIQSI